MTREDPPAMTLDMPMSYRATDVPDARGPPVDPATGKAAGQGRRDMLGEAGSDPNVFLLERPPSRRKVGLAVGGVLASGVFFCAMAPFATVRLTPVPAFIPAYESALVVLDLITTVLILGQFLVLRSRSLLVLASGYLFTAMIELVHALTFPGVFSASGLLGAGPQTAAWLYMFWHGGFPFFVVAYTLLKDEAPGAPTEGRPAIAIAWAVASVAALVFALTLVATQGVDSLPALVDNGRFTPALTGVVTCLWMFSALAAVLLFWRKPHTTLDLWLMVVMCTWLFDIALSSGLGGGRYDLGWYGGRAYGLLSASYLLIVLLAENGTHYGQLARMSSELSFANRSLEKLSLHDGMTELANRRFFDLYLADQAAVASRYDRPLALVLCDVDAFKAYNDHYGHQGGDECLKRIAAGLTACARRPADMAARYGGEEFALVLPDTSLEGATIIAEAARDAIARLRIPHARSGGAPYVSISGGVAVMLHRQGMTCHQLIAAADAALYRAKALGRNRVVVAPAVTEAAA